MAQQFQQLHLKPATTNRTTCDLSHPYLTTFDMQQIVPTCVIETLPTSHITGNIHTFGRLAPMALPTFAKLDFKQCTYFIPAYQLASDFEDYVSGESMSRGVPTRPRRIDSGNLMRFLVDCCTSDTSTTGPKAFKAVLTGSTWKQRYWTPVGRYVYKVLKSLGYEVTNYVAAEADKTLRDKWVADVRVILNAMPLLAFFKAFNDYMSNAYLYDNSLLSSFLDRIRRSSSLNTLSFKYPTESAASSHSLYVITNTGINLTQHSLWLLFDSLSLLYDSDLLTSAWSSPDHPTGSGDSELHQVSFTGSVNSATDYGSIFATNRELYAASPSTNDPDMNARAMRYLSAIDKYVRRNNYVGGRSVQRILSRYGIMPKEYRSDYVEKVTNVSSTPIMIGDVTSTAASGNSPLGDYAGKGVFEANHQIDFKSDDYGYLITLSWIAPQPFYAIGFEKQVLRLDPFDYYQPEFDRLDADPISSLEVCSVSDLEDAQPFANGGNVFGFTERYNAGYRQKFGKICGDYTLFSGSKSWTFYRELSPDVRAQDENLIGRRCLDGAQFNYIFEQTSSIADHFFCTMYNQITANHPIASISEATGLESGNMIIDRAGIQVS